MSIIDEWDVAMHAVPGARFVTPDEYREGRPDYVFQGLAVLGILTDALADAADEDGVISDFKQWEFYATYVRNVLCEDEDGDDFQLTYDRFTAFALKDYLTRLLLSGLLGHRGKGDSFDYRLTLPAEDAAPAQLPGMGPQGTLRL